MLDKKHSHYARKKKNPHAGVLARLALLAAAGAGVFALWPRATPGQDLSAGARLAEDDTRTLVDERTEGHLRRLHGQ